MTRSVVLAVAIAICVPGVAHGGDAAQPTLADVAGRWVAAVDGKPAAELTLAELRKALTADGANHALTLRRGEATVDLDVVVATVSLDD